MIFQHSRFNKCLKQIGRFLQKIRYAYSMSHLFGSQTSLREANRSALLSYIRRFGAITQIELAEATGLSTATVSTLVRQLVSEGRLCTESTIRNGRRATLVTLARRTGISVGLCINKHALNLVFIDYELNIIAERTLLLPKQHVPDVTLERAIRLINETLANINASAKEVVGIGIAITAPIDKRSHTVVIPGIMPHWNNVDIIAPLQAVFKIPVSLDNASNCCAVWESRAGVATKTTDFIYISADDGIGASIMADGKIWRGVTGMAGEIGHIQVDPLGSICACGNRGCLNTFVNEERITSLLSVTHGNLTIEDLVHLANEGDPGCRRIIADTAIRIGTVTAELCTSVDPEIVVIGGLLVQSGSIFVDAFTESLHRLLFPDVLTPIQVAVASNLNNCPALGAALEGIDAAEKLHPAIEKNTL